MRAPPNQMSESRHSHRFVPLASASAEGQLVRPSRSRSARPRGARSGIAKATRAPRPTKAKTSKLDVLGAKRRKTRRGVKQLTHFRRCGIYLVGLVGAGQRVVCDGSLESARTLSACKNAKHHQMHMDTPLHSASI